ncbi:MAG: hypothetical protein H6707_07380 [Deltaproteobacteria bacterium]|nr:hypothetical protein [Deltaproteobacteria bacterium]
MRKSAKRQQPSAAVLEDDGYAPCTRILLAGSLADSRLAESLEQRGYAVSRSPLGYRVIQQIKQRQRCAVPPADAVVVDLARDTAVALSVLDAIRQIDWSMPIIALYEGDASFVEHELRRLAVTRVPANLLAIQRELDRLMPARLDRLVAA